jgi:hypothetical protein
MTAQLSFLANGVIFRGKVNLTPHALRFTTYRFAVTARRNPRPDDGRDSGLIGGNVRTDLFDNDLFDLLGKTLGDFHVLQNIA